MGTPHQMVKDSRNLLLMLSVITIIGLMGGVSVIGYRQNTIKMILITSSTLSLLMECDTHLLTMLPLLLLLLTLLMLGRRVMNVMREDSDIEVLMQNGGTHTSLDQMPQNQ